MEPPDPIPNSEVKRDIADGSVGLPHVRVGQCQALKSEPHQSLNAGGAFFMPNAVYFFTLFSARLSQQGPYE